MMLENGWINKMHTNVPGPDGNISYGGACLPKDINAYNQLLVTNNLNNNVVDGVIKERNIIRDK